MLRQTRKWHAQINLGGRQVHLGFWATEEEAARAYDRAAINKGAREKSRILTNFDIKDYRNEVGILAALEANEVLDVLAVEMCASPLAPGSCIAVHPVVTCCYTFYIHDMLGHAASWVVQPHVIHELPQRFSRCTYVLTPLPLSFIRLTVHEV